MCVLNMKAIVDDRNLHQNKLFKCRNTVCFTCTTQFCYPEEYSLLIVLIEDVISPIEMFFYCNI
jgi:hypothetical protein